MPWLMVSMVVRSSWWLNWISCEASSMIRTMSSRRTFCLLSSEPITMRAVDAPMAPASKRST